MITSTNKNNILEVSNLSKHYGKIHALDDVSLSLPRGKIVGLLGPNGSGKTTLMKILTGIICSYQGDVKIDGHSPDTYTKSIVSYLPDKHYFSDWMRPVDIIKIFEDFYKDFDKSKMMEMLKILNLDPKQKIKTMSKGTIEKLQLSLVMSRKALLYVLDEPLGGIDPAARDFILDTIIKNYNPEGTVLISTHLIEDIERIFDWAIFIKDGKITLSDDIDSIKEKHQKSVDQLFREEFKCI